MKKPLVILSMLALLSSCSSELFTPMRDQGRTTTRTEDRAIEKTKDAMKETDDFQVHALNIINEYRAKGCQCGDTYYPPVAPLQWDDRLEKAAYKHALDMSQNDFYAHRGSDGSNSAKRTEREGYNWYAIGENIAFGNYKVEDIVKIWVDSPVHCKNLMNKNFIDMGLAFVDGYWVQNLGKPEVIQ